ncbi:hypothetical protein C8Q73DRAFT_520716 [Cubamyces lactineus]|nr:hypothetical protein C8Q73DRAFT_520716 [Cubamyces lactineus]
MRMNDRHPRPKPLIVAIRVLCILLRIHVVKLRSPHIERDSGPLLGGRTAEHCPIESILQLHEVLVLVNHM